MWAWQWAVPGDARVPWDRAAAGRRSPPTARAAKRAAVACFATPGAAPRPGPEDAAVLPPEVLAHFDRDAEVVFR